jgi:hypothetical protein
VLQAPATKKDESNKGSPGGKDAGKPQSKTTRAQNEDMVGEEGFLVGKEKREGKASGGGVPRGWNNSWARGWFAGRLENEGGKGRGFPLVFHLLLILMDSRKEGIFLLG